MITKKEGTIRFITNYLRLNQQFSRKVYPLPSICDTMKELEVFRYAVELCINMVYYTIRLSPSSQDMTTIVTGFGNFIYNRLHMDMCASGDIFQAKVDELIGDIEGVKTHIDDILVLR